LLAMRAILGESVAASRMGDVERSDELWRLIDLMMCTPSAKLRSGFAGLLVEQGFDERAEAIYRVLFPWVAFGSDEGPELYSAARDFNRALGDRQRGRAAEVFDLGITAKFEETEFYPAGYVSLPTFVHRAKALAAIERRDEAAIRDQTDALLRLSPADIDFAEKSIKAMRQAGFDELADETIERVYQVGGEYMRRFPLDVVTANNLAWVLALSDHRLDDALALSRRAVYLTPDSTVYRDTLAEVLFRLGRANEAAAIARACLIDEPAEWHVHEQIRRFEAAMKD
jgi:tetratricopeptide (TPR) repeat protein